MQHCCLASRRSWVQIQAWGILHWAYMCSLCICIDNVNLWKYRNLTTWSKSDHMILQHLFRLSLDFEWTIGLSVPLLNRTHLLCKCSATFWSFIKSNHSFLSHLMVYVICLIYFFRRAVTAQLLLSMTLQHRVSLVAQLRVHPPLLLCSLPPIMSECVNDWIGWSAVESSDLIYKSRSYACERLKYFLSCLQWIQKE